MNNNPFSRRKLIEMRVMADMYACFMTRDRSTSERLSGKVNRTKQGVNYGVSNMYAYLTKSGTTAKITREQVYASI